MLQIATTIEQSKKLIELGLSADTADMYYYNNDEIPQIISDIKLLKESINPKFYTLAWSLSALIELLSYGDILCMGKAAKDDGYLWISVKQSLPNNPLIRDNEVYPSMIDMILDRYIYPYLGQKK